MPRVVVVGHMPVPVVVVLPAAVVVVLDLVVVVVVVAGAVVVVAPPGGQGFVEQSPGPTLSPPWALHSAGVRSMQVSRKAPIGDDRTQHWVCACVVVVVVEVVVVETGTPAGVDVSDPHGSAAHEPFDVVPTQTLPPRGARHAAAPRTVWQCVTPLASVRQHRTALGRPQVEPAAQARSCALHPSESVPLLTAARATPATQRT